MKGFPKTLNSKQDYQNIIDEFGYCKEVKRAYQGLLNTSKKWKFDKLLDSEDNADSGDNYKVMEDEDRGLVQYQLVDNPEGKIFKLGFTISEVEEVISKC